MNIERILCPIDFSDASTHAIDQAVAFASWRKARITVLHVCSPLHLSDTGLEMAGRGEAPTTPKRNISAPEPRPIVKRRRQQASAWTS